MPAYEYKVMPAPNRAVKAKGVKGTAARFAHGLETLMNEVGAEGWEYLRADVMPCEERQGLRGRVEVDQHVLVFRRTLQSEAGALLMTNPVAVTSPFGGAPVDAKNVPDQGRAARLGPALRRPTAEAADE